MASETKPKKPWAERIEEAKIMGGESTLAALYKVAKNPETATHDTTSHLPPLPPRAKGHPTPWLNEADTESHLKPLTESTKWTLEHRLPTEEEQDRIMSECGCSPGEAPKAQTEKLAFLKNTYDFPSIEAADSFLADVKILSDVGEFHHYDSYSMAPLKASGSDFSTASPVSLTFFVQTHSAISEGDKKPGVTIRDVRYAVLLEHLYHSAYPERRLGQ
ncbi:hypothetical protein DFP72DRAFT_841424 [Ephemerocybe angulata]|uniref:Uncharacterized protein n=1 Tax=Ephemerocybe angulata TaxID=980116 RepID=A0A8H6ID23_9AGAR|nr:hypothetical protein DFP72DRAFT_841424 [Tulosesus angulatus]